MQQEVVRDHGRPSGFAFVGFGVPQPRQTVICGRSPSWELPRPRLAEDDDVEPNIVRGRE